MQHVGKIQAVIEIMQRTCIERFVAERKIDAMVGAGQIRFIDDPQDSRKKLISREQVEAAIQSLTPGL